MAEFSQYIHDATFGMPPMIGKRLTAEEWLSYVRRYCFTGTAPDRVVLHHTWNPDEKTWAGLNSMRGMQSYYAGMGWTAAPHIYAAPDGIWLFTPLDKMGIHANAGNGLVRNGKVAWYSIGVLVHDTRLF